MRPIKFREWIEEPDFNDIPSHMVSPKFQGEINEVLADNGKKTLEMENRLLDHDKQLTEENKRLRKLINKPTINWELVASVGYVIAVSATLINDLKN